MISLTEMLAPLPAVDLAPKIYAKRDVPISRESLIGVSFSHAIEVQHLADSSKTPTCPSGKSWIEHWKKSAKESSPKCSAANCKAQADRGAHVQIVEDTSNTVLIAPVCELHNPPTTGIFFVNPGTVLVFAEHCTNC